MRLDAFGGSLQLKYKLIFGMLEVPKTCVHPVAMGVFQSGKVSAVNCSHVFLQEILWLAQASLSVYAQTYGIENSLVPSFTSVYLS